MDIVGYSMLPMDQQHAYLHTLQEAVRHAPEFARAQSEDQLIRLPTGDGMALVFFGDPQGPVRCAMELSRGLSAFPEIKLRMGIHTGPVYRVADINANRNVAGGGINTPQRVMDCGDAGHILLSHVIGEVLAQVGFWNAMLHDLGEVEVKHKAHLHLYSLYTAEVGNCKLPDKLRAFRRRNARKKGILLALAAGAVTAAVAIGAFLSSHPVAIVWNKHTVLGSFEEFKKSMWANLAKAGGFEAAESDREAFGGHLGKAREFTRRAVESARGSDDEEMAGLWQVYAALREAELSNFARANEDATMALAMSSDDGVRIVAALTFARAGNSAAAQALVDGFRDHHQMNPDTVTVYWLPMIRAAVEINRGEFDSSLELLNSVVTYKEDFQPDIAYEIMGGSYPIYLRGEACLSARRGNDAATDFEKILDKRVKSRFSWTVLALAHLGLARSYALSGDTAKAKAAYKDFLTLWKDADPDIPILKEAKAEYAKLQ